MTLEKSQHLPVVSGTRGLHPGFPWFSSFLGDRYDWTTGAPCDGNEWKKYRVVPRAHPSRTLLYVFFNRSGSKEPFSFPGATWALPLYGGTFARSYSVFVISVVSVISVNPALDSLFAAV